LVVNTLASWNSERDGSGSAPGSFGAADGFFVQAGHSMTTSADATVPYLTLEPGATITASNLISCDYLVLQNGAIFEQQYASVVGTYITDFFIYDEATWIHNNTGWLPAVNRYFDPNSNQVFKQWGGGTFPSGTVWGNVMLDGTTVGDFGMGTVLTNIQGDFEWKNIGTTGVNYLYDQIDETINIGGDLIFSGGYWQIAADNSFPKTSTANVTINVAGDFKMTAGTLTDYISGTSGSSTVLNIGGNVEITGGTLDFNTAPDNGSTINLTGGSSAVTWTQTGGTVTLGNINIAQGKEVTLAGSTMGNVAASRVITVADGGTLHCATHPVEGPGGFSVQSGGTLGMGATNAEGALTSTASAGNVQVTGSRVFSGNATYIYNGAANQYTGNQLPATITGGLQTNNTGGNVALTRSTRVEGALTLTNGHLVSTSSNRFTIGATASIAPARGSSTSFVSGWIDRETNAAADFEVPIGSAADNRWRPLTITGQDATTRIWTVEFVDSDPETDWGSTYDAGDPITLVNGFYYYNISPDVGGTIDLRCWYNDADLGTMDETQMAVGHWSGSEWNTWNKDDLATDFARDATNNWIQVLDVSGFSPIAPGGGETPLPIELLHFTATAKEASVALRWSTATEINNDYFTVERSADGEHFEPIGRVKGAGNSNKEQHYQLMDNQPYSGISYYRLRQTDVDGSTTTAPMQAVEFGAGSHLEASLFPNPANHEARLSYHTGIAEPLQLQLFDVSGSLVYQAVLPASAQGNVAVQTGTLPAGYYNVRLSNSYEVQHVRLLIRH